jgi:hypothetical protein
MARILSATIALGLGAIAISAFRSSEPKPAPTAEVQFVNDGAFRDGWYLGKLAAMNGWPMRAPTARWPPEHDRAMFSEGYRRGYAQASRAR